MFSFTNTTPLKLDGFQGIGKDSDEMFYSDDDTIFVVCENKIPFTFTNEETQAKELIKMLAFKDKAKIARENLDYNYYLTLDDESSISIWSVYKNWLISFDKLIIEYSYYKVSKNKFKK